MVIVMSSGNCCVWDALSRLILCRRFPHSARKVNRARASKVPRTAPTDIPATCPGPKSAEDFTDCEGKGSRDEETD